MPTYRNGQTGEIIETLTYVPGIQGGTDLEAATKTISNTSENATPDYTSIHTLVAPTDSRIAVLRGCMRLTVTIDSWGGGGVQLNARVKRGGASVWTGILAVAAATGQKIISWDITTLITGAQTNTLFLWVDAGTCVISEVTMWTGVGSMQASMVNPCMSLSHTGITQCLGRTQGVGTGTHSIYITDAASSPATSQCRAYGSGYAVGGVSWGASSIYTQLMILAGITYLYVGIPTVATDIVYFAALYPYLRSQP
jgi:hypothetical protein